MSGVAGEEAARRAAAILLETLLEAGVTETLSEAPADWRAAPAAAPAFPPPPATPPPPRAASRSPAAQSPAGADAAAEEEAAMTAARAAAAAAADLPALHAALAAFEGSPLKAGAKRCVFADGSPSAELMIVGEAPGRDEDRLGLPFVGRSGRLLDLMLAAIGRDRASDDPKRGAYITNVVPWRPLQNRTPDDQEVRVLAPFVERHVELAQPKLVLCLGNAPAKHLMGATSGITRFRGTWREPSPAAPWAMLASFHPAYLLRAPDMKRLAWRDLIAADARLEALANPR